jgi:hypothetical protein
MSLITEFHLNEDDIIWMESMLDNITTPRDLGDFMHSKLPFRRNDNIALYIDDKPKNVQGFVLVHTLELFWKKFYFYLRDETPSKRQIIWARNVHGEVRIFA